MTLSLWPLPACPPGQVALRHKSLLKVRTFEPQHWLCCFNTYLEKSGLSGHIRVYLWTAHQYSWWRWNVIFEIQSWLVPSEYREGIIFYQWGPCNLSPLISRAVLFPVQRKVPINKDKEQGWEIQKFLKPDVLIVHGCVMNKYCKSSWWVETFSLLVVGTVTKSKS